MRQQCVCLFITNVRLSSRFFGGGQAEDEDEKVVRGDDVIVDLDASLEDLYMGGSLKVLLCSICNLEHVCPEAKEIFCEIGYIARHG